MDPTCRGCMHAMLTMTCTCIGLFRARDYITKIKNWMASLLQHIIIMQLTFNGGCCKIRHSFHSEKPIPLHLSEMSEWNLSFCSCSTLGTPCHHLKIGDIVATAVREALVYKECGLDGVMVENMHDVPYLRRSVGPEVVACMTRVCSEVRRAIGSNIPLGVQVLAGESIHMCFLLL